MDQLSRQTPLSPKARGGIFCKLSRACAANGSVCLAAIAVLTLIIIVMFVYYHGLLGLGPYTGAKPHKGAMRKRRKTEDDEGGGAAASDDRADPETEKLIDTINSA